ncbi:MAG: hypothetical protein IT422_21140 [Pirellulaceae bacterium]|nr:hypothetical protein [Pirellulaceae bacterium]
MARSRRKYRRSTSRNAASLLALALPAPLQRLAGSQVGPLLVFFGVPAMLVVGLLQIDWQNGTPHLTVNAEKAGELRNVVKGQLESLEGQPIVQQWEQTARDAWRSHQQSTQQQYPQQQYPIAPGSVAANNSPSGWAPSAAPFPSTSPPNSLYISTPLPSQSVAAVPNYSHFQSPSSGPPSSVMGQYQQQQDYSQQPYSQQQYQQPQYEQPQYQQPQYQQPQYQQPQYQQPLSAEQSWQAHTPWQSR